MNKYIEIFFILILIVIFINIILFVLVKTWCDIKQHNELHYKMWSGFFNKYILNRFHIKGMFRDIKIHKPITKEDIIWKHNDNLERINGLFLKLEELEAFIRLEELEKMLKEENNDKINIGTFEFEQVKNIINENFLFCKELSILYESDFLDDELDGCNYFNYEYAYGVLKSFEDMLTPEYVNKNPDFYLVLQNFKDETEHTKFAWNEFIKSVNEKKNSST